MQKTVTLCAVAALTAAATAPSLLAQAPKFADPVRLSAGEAFLGQGRLYPSPMFQDMNGDGLADIVVGDLPGRLTVALRLPGDRPSYAAETKLKALDGKELDFGNW